MCRAGLYFPSLEGGVFLSNVTVTVFINDMMLEGMEK